jgi:hypothetical protein
MWWLTHYLAMLAAGTAQVCAAIADRASFDLKDMALRQILCTNTPLQPRFANCHTESRRP